MSIVIPSAKYLGEKLLSAGLDRLTDRTFKYLSRVRIPGLTRFHFAELKSKVSHMPFIYQGLDSEVLTDFVDIDMTALDPNLMRRSAQRFEMTYQQRIANHKHVILFGRGGVGKTTYLRRTILDIISGQGRSHLFEDDVLVPFYVPLKAIDNTEELPILNFLLRDNSFLAGQNVGQLMSLARARKLMLCLDGYDEIPFASADMAKSPVMKELAMLTGSLDPWTVGIAEEYKAFYGAVAYCRVWVTSRLEFYTLNRFDIGGGALAVEIKGVPAQNRARLVKRIFDRYQPQLKSLEVEVSHENFIQRIERSGRDELITLSLNPLFLTVMAYIYVNRVIQENKYDVGLVQNVVDLISECVNLLLVDLDRFRARDLPAAHRDGLLCRRSEWITEKLDFLRYFAFHLLREAQPTFTAEDIKAQALMFFRTARGIQQAEVIISSMSQPSSLPNFVDQLIFCGIFVQVSRTSSGISLDFPHRKFREVLGAEFLARMDAPDAALQEFIDKPQLEESLYGIVESTTLKDKVVSLLLLKATQHDDFRTGLTLSNCLDRAASQGYVANDRLWQFFFSGLENQKTFKLPRRVLRHVSPTPGVLVKLVDILRQSILNSDHHRIALSSELIQFCFGVKDLVGVLELYLTSPEVDENLFPLLVYEYLSAHTTAVHTLLRMLSSTRKRALDVGVALATCVARQNSRDHKVMLREFVTIVDDSDIVPLLYLAGQVHAGVIPALFERGALPARYESLAWLCHKWAQVSSRKPAVIITLKAIEDALQACSVRSEDKPRVMRLLLALRGSIYSDEEAVLPTATSGSERIPHAIREALIVEARVRSEVYERVQVELATLAYTSCDLPQFFEGNP